MRITLCIEQDAESSGCNWQEVEKAVHRWAATHAASLSYLCPAPQAGMTINVALQTDDLFSAIRRLHDDLYDLQVNFTVSFHS